MGRLQGFIDNLEFIVSDAKAYKQFGNLMAVFAVQAAAEKILEKQTANSYITGTSKL